MSIIFPFLLGAALSFAATIRYAGRLREQIGFAKARQIFSPETNETIEQQRTEINRLKGNIRLLDQQVIDAERKAVWAKKQCNEAVASAYRAGAREALAGAAI